MSRTSASTRLARVSPPTEPSALAKAQVGDKYVFGHEVDLDFVLHDRAEIVDAVERTGLLDVEWYLRGPMTSREETTERLYVLARKP